MKSGTGPTRINHRDYDYHKSFGTTNSSFGYATTIFPDTYNTDADFPIPNQDLSNTQFTPPVPPMPNGCTDYGQSEVATDLDSILKNPETIENVTHANADGGTDIRTSLQAAIGLQWITGFFNIQAYELDFFDTIRLAMVSGGTEKRSVSMGTPWFVEWQGYMGQVMPMPSNLTSNGQIWHNWKVCGWKQVNGVPVLIGMSWQGPTVGDNGRQYFPREVINSIMAISGTVAFTTTKGKLPPISTISVTFYQWLVSNLKNLLGLQY